MNGKYGQLRTNALCKSALHFCIGASLPTALVWEFQMTERMQNYRDRQSKKGLVQIRLWIEKDEEEFFKFLAKMNRPSQKLNQPKERYGRQATQQQIDRAEDIANRLNVSPPKHLYPHHISLCGWIWANISR